MSLCSLQPLLTSSSENLSMAFQRWRAIADGGRMLQKNVSQDMPKDQFDSERFRVAMLSGKRTCYTFVNGKFSCVICQYLSCSG